MAQTNINNITVLDRHQNYLDQFSRNKHFPGSIQQTVTPVFAKSHQPSIASTPLSQRHFSSDQIKSEFPPSTQTIVIGNKWGFADSSWHKIAHAFPTVENIYSAIVERRKQINESREKWRQVIQKQPIDPKIAVLAVETSLQKTYRIAKNQLMPSPEGLGGAYFLMDANGQKRYVVKPIDEDIGCLNNTKGWSTPDGVSPMHDCISLYLSSMRETLACETAKEIKVSQIAPQTALAIFESEAFNDQIDQVDPQERVRYEQLVGPKVKEKLCSVQEYVPDSITLKDLRQDFQKQGLSDKEMETRIDQRDFEDANILVWTTYDNDCHLGNILAYPKSKDAAGHIVYGLKKIDNSMTFPEQNDDLTNNLYLMPNAERPLSSDGRAKIAAISIEALVNRAKKIGLSDSTQALRSRLVVLKELAKRKKITIEEITLRMSLIGEACGIQRALA